MSIQGLDGNSRPQILKLLLPTMKTSDVNDTQHWTKDNTALHKAVINNDLDVVKILLESGKVDTNMVNSDNQTPLQLAIDRRKRPKIIKLLKM